MSAGLRQFFQITSFRSADRTYSFLGVVTRRIVDRSEETHITISMQSVSTDCCMTKANKKDHYDAIKSV